MNRLLRRIHALVAWALVIVIALAAFLAGSSIAQLGGSNSFRTHMELGYWIGIVAAVLVATALIARVGRRAVLITLAMLALYIVQTSLPLARDTMPALAALHPVNALLLFAISAWYARTAWGIPVGPASEAARVGG